MVNTVRVNADHGRDFHPLADHMTKLHKLAGMSQWILGRFGFSQN